ncbi:hypothetical protein EIK77_010328 [Talaromyces pinophilus]|nr:hypothetical protein EIK77_010328 [Talaromyces pinophilus]
MAEWSPTSWTSKPIKQDVTYEDPEAVKAALAKLQKLPPLVTPHEIVHLKNSLRNAALGKAFVLQGGDCAELFDYCNQDTIEAKIKLLLQMSLVLVWDWGLGHVIAPSIKQKYEKIINAVTDALRFMHTVGVDQDRRVATADIYTSHEGLSLEYEQSFTRLLRHPPEAFPSPTEYQEKQLRRGSSAAISKGYYDTSAHFLWIGDRTRQVTGAHVEFFRGLSNPIGIKIGPSMTTDELVELLNTVNPTKEIGKVTLISRYGADKIAKYLPAHIAAVQASGHLPVWQCDPMHGNTQSTPSGVKTRHFTNILSELKQALEIHRAAGSYLGGMHLELTGEAVTECVGGAGGLTEEGLSERYETFCDPRLNEKQALELAFLVAGFYREDMERGEEIL